MSNAVETPEQPKTDREGEPDLRTRDFSLSGIERVRKESDEEESDEEESDEARYELTFSSDAEVEVWPGIVEILGHGEDEVDADWIRSGNAPLLWQHRRDQMRGVVESAKFSDGKGHAVVRIAPSQEDTRKDLDAGVIKNVSVGFRVLEEKLVETSDERDLYRVTKWQPKEISLVSIPADKSVGLERAEILATRAERRKCHLSLKEPTNPETSTMAEPVKTEEPAPQRAEVTAEEREKMRKEIAKTERQRQIDITQMGARFGMEAEATKAIDDNIDAKDFGQQVLSKLPERAGGVTSDSIGLTEKEQKRFSVMNVVNAMITGKRSDAEFEFEVSDAVKEASDRQSEDERIALPADVVLRGWVPKDERFRDLMGITVGDTSATNIVPPEYRPEMFIEALRENSVLLSSGVNFLPGLTGDTVNIPREILDILFYWVGEDAEPTEGVYGLDDVTLNYKTIAGRIPFTRRAGKTTIPNLETLLLNNIRVNLALSIERTLISSTESATVPGGIFETSGIGAVTTGGTLTHGNILEFEEALGDANADTSRSIGFTNTHGKKLLLEVEKSTGSGNYLAKRLDNGDIVTDIGTFKISNLVPRTFSTDKTGMLYGNPSSLVVGMWGGVELARDTATKIATGGVVLRVFQDLDMVCGRPAEWAAATDIT